MEEEMLSAMMADMMLGGAAGRGKAAKAKAKAKLDKKKKKADEDSWETDSDDDAKPTAAKKTEQIPEVTEAEAGAADDADDWESDSDG